MSTFNQAVQSGQTMVVLPASAFEQLANTINEVKDLMLGKVRKDAGDVWIESQEARKMLGVSQKTWQNYRNKRILPFSQFGRKIYVRKADIDTFLNEHYINKSSDNS